MPSFHVVRFKYGSSIKEQSIAKSICCSIVQSRRLRSFFSLHVNSVLFLNFLRISVIFNPDLKKNTFPTSKPDDVTVEIVNVNSLN